MTLHKLFLCLSLGTLTGLAGCSSQAPDSSHFSGFLGDYSTLKPATSASGVPVLRWIDPAFQASRYRSVLIERPVYDPQPRPSERIDQKTLDDIPVYLQNQITRQLGGRFRVVTQPEPDTLILRSAISGVSVDNQSLRAYEVIPIALVVAATSTAIGTRDQETSVYLEVEAIDHASGKPVIKVVRKGMGKTLDNASQKLTLDDLKPALDVWARDAANFH
ncbi:MAG: hypothetical protein GAK45_02261 [Pseudomonas citronellolis]|nr:MAG: hypothetical protein GAK45_02261 [Pseudomonas citronellolis]